MNINLKPVTTAQNKVSADIKIVEFELSLGTHNIAADSFERCIKASAEDTGFVTLFNFPIPFEHDLQRLAAFAAVSEGAAVFVFVGLHRDGNRAIFQPDLSALPHIAKFAEAFFDLIAD
ncbi:MAG: hypothetical protein U5K75_09695 [Ahrensia sp.]|nr:hypothetical protein [Ahrensia sp.]